MNLLMKGGGGGGARAPSAPPLDPPLSCLQCGDGCMYRLDCGSREPEVRGSGRQL